jgi:hypothetical protein
VSPDPTKIKKKGKNLLVNITKLEYLILNHLSSNDFEIGSATATDGAERNLVLYQGKFKFFPLKPRVPKSL